MSIAHTLVGPTRVPFLVAPIHARSLTMSLTPLPVHAVDASPAYLAALTGANILLFDRDSGNLRAALAARIDAAAPVARDAPEAAWAAFPRLCALSPSGHLLAVASDDKTLRVWRTDAVAYGREVLVQRLAKRAGTLQWVRCAAGEEVVVADKFGDVYSFVVDESNAPVNAAALPDAAADTDDPADAAIQPRLGHVSMVTCVAFLGDGVQPESIVTCDRDEHIRISRWGVRRAAHIVQQYVLGSRSFVGAIVVVPAVVAQRAGIDGDVLISSDGGACLRVWRRADGEYKLHRVAALDAARLANSVAVDAAVERRREKVAGNVTFTGVFDPSEPEREAKRPRRNESAPAESAASTVVVIQQLRLFRAADRDWLLLTIEGATALFVVPLDALAAAGTKADEAPVDMRAVDVGAPVLDAALVQGEEPTVYVCCDVRPGMGSGAPVRQFTWRGELVSVPCEVLMSSLRATARWRRRVLSPSSP